VSRRGRGGPHEGSPSALELGAVFLLLCLGVVFYLGPSIGGPVARLGPDLGDPMLNLALMEWSGHALAQGELFGLWSPPFFYPTSGALTYSDHLLGPAVALRLLGLVGVGPVTAYNMLLVLTFVLGGAATWWVLRAEGASFAAALAGGWLFAFAPMRWEELSHYQVLRAQWIPLLLWSFDRLLVERSDRRLLLFLAFYVLHVSGGAYLAYMVHVPLAAILVVRLTQRGRRPLGRAEIARFGLGAAASAAILAFFYWGYLARWGARAVARSVAEVRGLGPTWSSLWTPAPKSWLASLGILPEYRERGALFLGFVASALVAVEIVARLSERRGARRTLSRSRWRLVAGACGLSLVALGWWAADRATLAEGEPAGGYGLARWMLVGGALLIAAASLRWAAPAGELAVRRRGFEPGLLAGVACAFVLAFPVGFIAFDSLLPGLDRMRVSYRFWVFVLFGAAWLAARGLDRLRRRTGGGATGALLLLLVGGCLVGELRPGMRRWEPVPERAADFPAYERWLAANAAVGAYVEYPMWGDWREAERMHFQSAHWKPMVNGYSAVISGSYLRVARLFDPFVDDAGVARLRRLGVTHIVLHWHERRPRARAAWNEVGRRVGALVESGALHEVFAADGISIYRISGGAGSAARRAIR